MPDDLDAGEQLGAVEPFSEWPASCDVCQNLWRGFSRQASATKVNLGFIQDALATQCHTHRPLIEGFAEYMRLVEGPDARHSLQDIGDLGIVPSNSQNSAQITESLSKGGFYWALLLVHKESVPNHPGTGRILNPAWVDADMLKRWKSQCLSKHGAKCENPLKIWPKRPAFLIDVRNKCLVPSHVPGAFVALSYRYGRVPVPTIDAITLEKLQEPYALDALQFDEFVSPVIRHAMALTSVINERYLWADALCIPHTNKELRAEELNMMGAIYANALVTIVAADGDAEDGLRGLHAVSQPRQLDQRIIKFGREELIVRNTGTFDLTHWSEYHDRAWTFQEHRMSARKIIFRNGELHWQCQCSVWHEEMICDAETDKYIDRRQNVIVAGFPDLDSLSDILSDFNTAELRYDEDALPAISGLLSVLSRSFTGGFLYGIPEMFFERGLGWTPQWDHTNIRRRTVSERCDDNRLSQASLPSWSWVGWQGLVAPFTYGEAARINDRQHQIEETTPITEWYTSSSSSDNPETRRRIRSTWFENRDMCKDYAKPLPPGWSRHDAHITETSGRDEPRLYPDGCGKYVFKHKDMPNTDRELWYYPFPIPEIQSSTPPVMPEQTSYLFCKTWKARLWGRQASKGHTAQLYNSAGEEVGSLRLHHERSLSLFPREQPEVVHGLPVDVIALYKSRVYWKTWDVARQKYDHPLQKEDLYIVLWVEWKDNVAYRLASGQVEADAWEKLSPQTIDLILG